jgi:NTP pyrophosphatase (non-canonical NTP hydrolase)
MCKLQEQAMERAGEVDFRTNVEKEMGSAAVRGEVVAMGISAAVQTLTEYCYGASHAAGWWVNAKTGVDTRSNPMCFSQKLMLIVSEVAEAMEGDRKGLMDDKLPHRPMREVELADALIRICDLAGAYGMDLGGAVEEKMAFNKVRPDHQLAARAIDGGKAY